MRRNLFSLALATAALLSSSAPLARAIAPEPASLLQQGHADEALAALSQKLNANTNDALTQNLACRVYFSEGQLEDAQTHCEKAVALAPNNSGYHLWLGRVRGRQAEHASALSAYGIAKQVREEFETAYNLNQHNAPAVADLAEFYVDAPRILGGGKPKALALADAAAPWNPALAHSIRAEIAQDDKDTVTAENELKAAANSPENLIALASFYRKQNRIPEMLATIDKAVAADSAHDDALVSAAGLLIRSNQRPDQAISLLRMYLGSPNRSEDAPAFAVHAQLADLLNQTGNANAAGSELARAHALASGWNPKAGSGSDS